MEIVPFFFLKFHGHPIPPNVPIGRMWRGQRSPVHGLVHHSAHMVPVSCIHQHDIKSAPRTLHIRLHLGGDTLSIIRHLQSTNQTRHNPCRVMSGRVQRLQPGWIRSQCRIPLPCACRMGAVIGIRRELH